MTRIGYLDILDEILQSGASTLRPALLDLQTRYALGLQQSDGGFPGRQGASDSYYTDFALRILSLTGYTGPAWQLAGNYFSNFAPAADLVEMFSRLHAARLLARYGVIVESPGFACRHAENAYQAFLAHLCAEMTGNTAFTLSASACDMLSLRCADGGFANLPGELTGQTNSTAAAIAVLTMQNALDDAVAQSAATFLACMQTADGGIRAHAALGDGDLLSTFTGVLTMLGLQALDQLDLPAVARFLKQLAVPCGGFHAALLDEAPDLEYTYYGLGTMAVLRAYLSG